MAQPKLNHPDARGLLRRVHVCADPVDTAQNASYALTWTNGVVTTITKTVGGVTYSRTLSYSGADCTAVSAWTEV